MSEGPAIRRPPYVAVIGDGDPIGPDAHRLLEWAEEIGQYLARGGAIVVTGGLGGIMRAASRGAVGAGGETIGILPGAEVRGASSQSTASVVHGFIASTTRAREPNWRSSSLEKGNCR